MTLAGARLTAFVGVSDLDAAELFYSGVLGLSLEDARPFALVAHVGGTQLRITAVEVVRAAPYTVLGWRVDDIEGAVVELVAKGVRLNRYPGMAQDGRGIWTSPDGARVAWFNDPDGNTLSLQA
jgi:catechol 2,3-dioxygenase-like lactoylglutathione lyase family enzyme